jgi:hypothetical protein
MPERWDYRKAGVDIDRAFEVPLATSMLRVEPWSL